jgi:signal transduction histidine kinase
VESIDHVLSRALDFALQGDLEQAQSTLAERSEPIAVQLTAFFAQQHLRERARIRSMAKTRHDVGNALSIAQGSIEAMLDGVVGITDPRLNRLRDILAGVSASVYELTAEGADSTEAGAGEEALYDDPVASEVKAIAALAEIKGVQVSYECSAHSQVLKNSRKTGAGAQRVRSMLLNALRYTPAGGTIAIERSAEGDLLWSINSAAVSNVLQAGNGVAQLLQDNGSEASVLVTEGI